ncbi:MAG TPA: major capsid protein [Pyrinomonadaceae bacterium]|nr:major capsid protein [Pyrinomonadaceae bacterium]
MADISGLIAQANTDGRFAQIANDPFTQFGTKARRYIGAELMPEKTVESNMFQDEAFELLSTLANDESRHSPPTMQKIAKSAAMSVILGDSGLASQLNTPDFDALRRYLSRGQDMDALSRLLEFPEKFNTALQEYNERQRWQMIVSSNVVRDGDNGYKETLAFDAPTGHRVNAGATWTGDATVRDPFTDILAGVDFLAGKGKTVSRIITGRSVSSILTLNSKMMSRTGVTVVNNIGAIGVSPARASQSGLSDAFGREGLPAPETYDLMWKKGATSGYFLPRNVVVLVAGTDNSTTVERNGQAFNLEGTIGYTAIGPVAGFSAPGRQIRVDFIDDIPPRVEGKSKQTSFPVLQDRESVYVISAIT